MQCLNEFVLGLWQSRLDNVEDRAHISKLRGFGLPCSTSQARQLKQTHTGAGVCVLCKI